MLRKNNKILTRNNEILSENNKISSQSNEIRHTTRYQFKTMILISLLILIYHILIEHARTRTRENNELRYSTFSSSRSFFLLLFFQIIAPASSRRWVSPSPWPWSSQPQEKTASRRLQCVPISSTRGCSTAVAQSERSGGEPSAVGFYMEPVTV